MLAIPTGTVAGAKDGERFLKSLRDEPRAEFDRLTHA
jgi:hypothetical protein